MTTIFFKLYGGTIISLNVGTDSLQPDCMYQIRVQRGLYNFCLGLKLVELVQNTC